MEDENDQEGCRVRGSREERGVEGVGRDRAGSLVRCRRPKARATAWTHLRPSLCPRGFPAARLRWKLLCLPVCLQGIWWERNPTRDV